MFSSGPVRYADGVVSLASNDLESDGFGQAWGLTRSWTNAMNATPNPLNGTGWIDTQLPYLLQANSGNTLIVISNGINYREFDSSGGNWTSRFYDQDTLATNTSGQEYIFTDTVGDQIRFSDFSGSIPANQKGQIKSFTDANGNVTSVISRTGDGKPTEVQRSVTVNGVTTTESYLYAYVGSGVNAGLMQNVTLRRQVNGGSWTIIRQVAYTYYDGVLAHGNAGDLRTATIEDGSGNVLDTKYYRYYVTESGGYQHGLKYLFNPDSYARLVAALGTNIDSLTDTQVAPYADNYYEYDSGQRVTKEIVQGVGCSSCSGGLGTFTFSYANSSFTYGINTWWTKTVETLPDGNQNIVYANYAAEVMLSVYVDVGSGLKWETFHKYDSSGRAILTALPSAVTGYDDTKPDLLNYNSQTGLYQYLRNTSGLIQITDYATSTTATPTMPGNVAGYLQDTKVEQGQQGTAMLTGSRQYIAQTAGGITIYPVANSTVYRNTDGTGPETTSYTYTFFSGTDQIQSEAVSLPVISSAQNGPATADVHTTFYDVYARPIWTKDPDGFINYTAFDPATGAVSKTITDVDTTRTGDFQNLPSGWSTPSGAGLHLITSFVVDGLGRPTQITDPNGNISYNVFIDTNYEIRTYPGWNSSTHTPTGPTQDTRYDRPGSYWESLTMSATPAVDGNGHPTGGEAISNLQTLSRSYISAGGQVARGDAYLNLTGVTYSVSQYIGTLNTNYYTTLYGYDDRGRPNRTQTPNGTIYRTVYDGLGRAVSTWVGTNDSVMGEWSPTNNGPPSNMIQVSGNVYDGGGVGDSDLTQLTRYPGGSAANRVTQNFFDWRDRLVARKSGVQASEDTTTHRPIFYYTYDNLGETTAIDHYDGDGVTITSTNGVPNAPSASLLRAHSITSYDDQGRVYLQQGFSVDQSNGTISTNSLNTNSWYNHRGQPIEISLPGGLVTKTVYDGAGRATKSYETDGAGGTSWSAASTVANDNVLTETITTYDSDDNPILVTTKDRFDNETGTGELGDPNTIPKARDSYMAYYYDLGNRLTTTVNVGTNGGTAYIRPSTPPAGSDTVLVTSTAYNAAGWLDTTTDPRGIVQKNFYDNLRRVTKTIAAYTDGNPTNNTNKTTEYTYDGNNRTLTMKADMPAGAFQTTQYIYGATTGTGSDVNSNDILVAIQYPDPTTGNPSSSQQETYTINALGDTKTKTDRNGNVHTLSYDVLGRLTADAVTTLGTGVDGTIRRIETAYDTGDRPYLFTSYNAATAGSIVNQVQDAYNGLGQLITEYQSHSGAVNTSTTPKVQYSYTVMAGGVNNSRLTSMTYPNGRVLNFNYATGVDNTISRLTSISDTSATLESLSYLGLDTVVKRSHPQPGVDLTYIKQTGEPNGDAGDQYTGLDRFGRVVDQRWLIVASGLALDRFQYGYDRDGNRLYRDNLVNAAFGELYHVNGPGNGYDQLNQLTNFARGTLNSTKDTIPAPTHSQSWGFDALGNWSNVTTDGTTQTRTANQQNEITSISGLTAPGYDANGNTTRDQAGNTLIFDAWNRLVQVKNGITVLQTYAYDGLNRRISENPGTLRDLYYDSSWQLLEEDVTGSMQDQYVWSPVYIDALIERDTPTQRMYVQQDANFNVMALVDTSGNVQERYVYDPYGLVIILAPNWTTRASSSYGWVYGYQGGRLDNATGLYVFRNRDYSPTLGRWMQIDPAGYGAGDPNLYRDVGNDPTSTVDPMGLQPKPKPKPTPNLSSGPVLGSGPNINQVGVDAQGNIIYGNTAYVNGQLIYTGTCYIIQAGEHVPVPCPSAGALPPGTDPGTVNCGGLAFETYNQLTLDQVEDKLKKCTELDDPKKKCDKKCDRKCYLWTFEVWLIPVNASGKPTGPGVDISPHDFHIVCQCTTCGMAVSKDGSRPVDPRNGPPDLFDPSPSYAIDPALGFIRKIKNLKLKVFCCNLKDVNK
jgi:RHS repeat-associated protein